MSSQGTKVSFCSAKDAISMQTFAERIAVMSEFGKGGSTRVVRQGGGGARHSKGRIVGDRRQKIG